MKKPRELTNQAMATALGWTDIKSWGGRGIRGIAPGEDRHQSLPRFTYSVTDILHAIAKLRETTGRAPGRIPDVSLEAKSHSSGSREYHAVVGNGRVAGAFSEWPAEALCLATLNYLKENQCKGN